jgi:RNA recognition motif-containing protein
MDSPNHNNPMDSILRRTIHVSNVPSLTSESEIRQLFQNFGDICQVKLDETEVPENKMALVQFASDEAAFDSMRVRNISFSNTSLRISPSKITIDVIPPTDAVFGKPMTVGHHVMAVNPSNISHDKFRKREEAMKAVDLAASKIEKSLAERANGGRIRETIS